MSNMDILNEIKNRYTYNQDTGDIINISTGDKINAKYHNRYYGFGFRLNGKKHSFLAHRAAYAMHHGYWPDQVDHIDRNGLNNKIENLIDVTHSTNQRNQKIPKNNTSGKKGVSFSKGRNKWIATIGNNGKQITIGRFSNKQDAINARVAKEKELNYIKD